MTSGPAARVPHPRHDGGDGQRARLRTMGATSARSTSADPARWTALLVLGILVLAIAPLVLARAFRSDRRWSGLGRYSLLSGALTFALLLVFGAEIVNGWNGLVQRVLMLVPLVWIAVLGARLVEIAGAGAPVQGEEQRGRV